MAKGRKMAWKERILTGGGGLLIGIINGLLGAGGGMLAVPLLRRSGMDQQRAHANSVAVIFPLALFSSVLYLMAGRVRLGDALPYLPGGIVGAAAGAFLLRKIPDVWLRRIFGIFMIWAGYRLLAR